VATVGAVVPLKGARKSTVGGDKSILAKIATFVDRQV
jgi:hypothetical protein